MNILNKITMKAIGAQPAPHSITEAVALAHLFGKANGYKTGSTTYGLYDKFHGEFEAVNLQTGECFVASNLLCPPIMESLIKDALKSAGAEGGKIGNKALHEADIEGKDTESPVLFAFEIGVKPTAKKEGARDIGQGYEYTVKLLAPSKRSDALESLRAISQQARQAALPGPAQPEPAKPASSAPNAPADQERHAKHAAGGKRR
jgi:hypothetical protein